MKNASKIVQFALAILGMIFCIMILAGNEDGIMSDSGTAGLNGAVWISIIAIIIGVAAALIFGVMTMISKGAKAKGTLFGILGLVGVTAVCYFLASSEVPPGLDPNMVVEAGVAKRVSAGVNLFLVLCGGAILAIIVGEVKSLVS